MEKKNITAVYSVDSFDNGIAFGAHHVPSDVDMRSFLGLKLEEDGKPVRLRSRYSLNKQNALYELELQLKKLSRQGILKNAQIFFGVTTDPFHPFEGKFDASMRFLEMFSKYTPGHLVIQTRSPLLVIAMPALKRLGERVTISYGIESSREDILSDLTPDMPRLSERLKAMQAFRRFGIEVHAHVSPLLPYGDKERDADSFAKLLIENSDRIYVRPLVSEHESGNSFLAKKIAQRFEFSWLRHDAAHTLIKSIEAIAPEKLKIPERPQLMPLQLTLFEAA